MQFKAIKKIAASIAVLVSATAGLSAMNLLNDCDSVRSSRPVQNHSQASWTVHIDQFGGRATSGNVFARVSRCGTIVDVSGATECIGTKERRRAVQLVEIIKILMGVECQYTNCHVKSLIKEFEICPCPDTVLVNPVCHNTSRPVTPVCGKRK